MSPPSTPEHAAPEHAAVLQVTWSLRRYQDRGAREHLGALGFLCLAVACFFLSSSDVGSALAVISGALCLLLPGLRRPIGFGMATVAAGLAVTGALWPLANEDAWGVVLITALMSRPALALLGKGPPEWRDSVGR